MWAVGEGWRFCCLGSSQTKLLLHRHRSEALMAALDPVLLWPWLGLVAAVLEGAQGWVPARAQQEGLEQGPSSSSVRSVSVEALY